jgi:hypothetical protein
MIFLPVCGAGLRLNDGFMSLISLWQHNLGFVSPLGKSAIANGRIVYNDCIGTLTKGE